MKRYIADAFFCTVFTFIVAGILFFSFINISILDPFEHALRDFKFTDIFYSHNLGEKKYNRDIAIVNVKHLDRFRLSQVVDKIGQQSPKAIGIDIIFKDRKIAFTDSLLNQAIGKYDNIVSAYYSSGDSLIGNHDYFKFDDDQRGYINLGKENQSGVIRNFMGARLDDKPTYSFATQVAMVADVIDESYAQNTLNSSIPIAYIGHKDVFLNFTADEILSSESIPALNDAIVLLGYTGDGVEAFDIEDKHFTPLNEKWVGRGVPDTYGVAIHANIINMLTKSSPLYKVPEIIIYAIAFLLCFVLVLIFMPIRNDSSFRVSIMSKLIKLVLPVSIIYAALLLLQSDIHIDVIPILLLSLLGVDMIGKYEKLVKYLNKKYQWKSQLLS